MEPFNKLHLFIIEALILYWSLRISLKDLIIQGDEEIVYTSIDVSFKKNNIAMQIKGKTWKWCFINCCCEMLLMIYKTLLSFQISNASIKSPPHPPFRIYLVFTESSQAPFMIYRVFTESSQAPFYDLQGFYRVKSGPLL